MHNHKVQTKPINKEKKILKDAIILVFTIGLFVIA